MRKRVDLKESRSELRRRFGLQYNVRKYRLLPRLQKAFVQLNLDQDTQKFIIYSMKNPYSAWWCWIRGSLMRYTSRYTADGILNMSRMHVLSTSQWRTILKLAIDEDTKTLLDVGAGDGFVTQSAQPLFSQITATESSLALSWRLRAKGFRAVCTEDLKSSSISGEKFDFVSCLNVLDRVDYPIQLLRDLKSSIKQPEGKVVLAVVLPFCPAVMGAGGSRPPKERLPVPGCCDGSKNNSWEDCVNALVERVLEPEGFQVEAVSRVPYLSHGDNRRGLYSLDDAVLVLSPTADAKDVVPNKSREDSASSQTKRSDGKKDSAARESSDKTSSQSLFCEPCD
mmetsp:Transcript_30673/g.42722  ORF Transcript_30673/g.42722 Transcript_30673/m.42722 type:complete len:339 (+) Transcript_30673:90-1106(+)